MEVDDEPFAEIFDHIPAPLAGQYVNIYVSGSKLGTAQVNSRGVAEIVRNSELAQGVPQVRAGTIVTVQTKSAAAVASGTF